MKYIKELWKTTDKSRVELWLITIFMSAGLYKLLSKLLSDYVNERNPSPFYYYYNINPVVIVMLLPAVVIVTLFLLRISDWVDERTGYVGIVKKICLFILLLPFKKKKRSIEKKEERYREKWENVDMDAYVASRISGWQQDAINEKQRMADEKIRARQIEDDARRKREAENHARKAQENADYATRQAVNQGKYNSNTSYYTNKANKAVEAQRIADKAKADLKKYK